MAGLIGFDEALARVVAEARPLGPEEVPLALAHGRVLAAPVEARTGAPLTDVSTMDGYAVRDCDLVAGGPLRVVGERRPGSDAGAALGGGECVRVFTGGSLPPGADRVVMQEEVKREGEMARFAPSPGRERFVRRAGSDFAAGERLLEAGTRLGPRALVAAAAGDADRLTVWRRPKVTILATGGELVAPGQAAARPGRLPDSISVGLAAMAAEAGAEVTEGRLLGDELAILRAAAGEALDRADVVVVTGGASVGDHDYARAMFEDHGLERIVDKVAIKPGKPFWFGRARGRLVMGLPGNPTSALVTARLFLVPLLRGLGGHRAALDWRSLPLAGDLPGAGPRETFSRGHEAGGQAHLLAAQESGAQRALAGASLLVRRPPGEAPVRAGSAVAVLDF